MGGDPGSERAEGVEALGPRPLSVTALQVAGRDVVGDGVAEDHLRHSGHRHLAADPADHHGQLTLEAQLGGDLRVDDRLPRPDHRGVGLEEGQRRDRDLVAELGGVRGVVAADPDHLAAGDDRREQAYAVELLALAGRLDRHGDRIAGQHRDRVRVPAAVLGELDDSVLRVAAVGEPGDAHCASLAGRRTVRTMSSERSTLRRSGRHPHQAGRRASSTDAQIDWMIHAFTVGEIADEQMSALAMAILLPRPERPAS